MASYDFCSVNIYLGAEIDARAIKSALELGIVDVLVARGAVDAASIAAELRINPVGWRLLVDLLEVNGVIARTGEAIELTAAFRQALRFRDLLEAKIAFADLVWPDIHSLFTPLLNDLPQFMARSRVFDLFRYDRAMALTPDNLEATRAWTRFTTCLTKYESAAVLDAVDMRTVGAFVDMGGNTGEFALQICRRHAAVRASVVDLPVVCAIGQAHVAASADVAAAARVAFFATDMRSGPLPPPADLVAFKSVLHDWPDAEAGALLERAHGVVRPGGRLLIFERAPIDMRGKRIPYAMAPDLAFLHFLRPADLYLSKLAALGYVAIEHRRIELDMDFHLIVARRPA